MREKIAIKKEAIFIEKGITRFHYLIFYYNDLGGESYLGRAKTYESALKRAKGYEQKMFDGHYRKKFLAIQTKHRPVAHTRTLKTGKTIIINPDVKKISEKNKMRKQHIVSLSGGKDSVAMLLRMIELKMPVDRILFCDTGLEFEGIYETIERINEYTIKKIGVPVETLYSDRNFDDWFYGKLKTSHKPENVGKRRGFPLFLITCYWTRESKFKQMEAICFGNYRYIGFAKNEKARVEKGSKKDGYCFPLNDWGWTEEDARQYLIKSGFAHQIHTDFNRTGCYLCPKQGEKSLMVLAKFYPHLWNKLISYTKDVETDPLFLSPIFRPDMGTKELKALKDKADDKWINGISDNERKVLFKFGHNDNDTASGRL